VYETLKSLRQMVGTNVTVLYGGPMFDQGVGKVLPYATGTRFVRISERSKKT